MARPDALFIRPDTKWQTTGQTQRSNRQEIVETESRLHNPEVSSREMQITLIKTN